MHRAMKKGGPVIRFLVVLSALLLLPHCSGMFREGGIFSRDLKPDEFPGEMKRLEEITRTDPEPSERAAAHRRLAALLSSQRNPSADYPRALEELRIAVALDPEKGDTDAVVDWLAVLTEVERLSREKDEMRQRIGQLIGEAEEAHALRERAIIENRGLKGAVEQLTKEERELKATAEKLTQENAELRNVVDQLKELDIQLEEKRRKVH